MPHGELSPQSEAFIAPPRGETHATEVVGDKLKVPKANGFAEGESTAC
jgi:hypothetical protein